MVSLTKEMCDALEDERVKRKLTYIQEVIRQVLGDYFVKRNTSEHKS